jgi:hypothetical protein
MALSLIETEAAGTVKPRKKRERIQIMELPPSDDWFQKSRDSFGREVWFVRIQMTGLRVRRYGPFPSKHKGILFIDHLLNAVVDSMTDASNSLERYQMPLRRFGARSGHFPIVEDELCSQ